MAEDLTAEPHRAQEAHEQHERGADRENPSDVARADDDSPRPKVMLLGAGELSRELVIVFQRFGAEVIAVEHYADAPAHRVADQSLVVKITDADELSAVIGRVQPNFVVALTDAVAADALAAAGETGFTEVVPGARGVRLSTDSEGLRRLAADELGLPTAPFWFAGSLDELKAVSAHAGYPLLVKPVRAVGGQAPSVVSGPDDVEPAWQRAVAAGGRVSRPRVLAETVVEVDYHVTLLTVCTDGPKGPVFEFCAPIGHGDVTGDAVESWQPQPMSDAALDAGKSIAARIVKAVGGRGVFGVELMARGDEVYFCDVTARPYDSGLVTLRTQRLSVFELQARAILGLAIDTIMISPGAAAVLYAGREAHQGRPDVGVLADALRVPESDVRVFAHHEPETPRRLGVALATAADVSTARDRARQVSAALRRLWQPANSPGPG
ncbi:formate-dependent phosphoribosylglycinamide formyltransferase [Mycobacterium xenopi]|uniref:Phosphoribosylglycinamide formyltransferase 2 n=1 Tax=Mycobacterium xenopi TaxID=1789 RepID=A0AAD1H5M0_MYCXE|nr:phosphoribosylglycinamide formyltransferase [Mycobacterium xenopi]BBU24645.1 phosphoribosylglycinamide formyltransferase 2 [Mycobacterium xenopi]SPX90064.1 formate-dependent phosphoribosylglycinamide formyltransferase (GAR transformylase) [Mycobacterium xenopi]